MGSKNIIINHTLYLSEFALEPILLPAFPAGKGAI